MGRTHHRHRHHPGRRPRFLRPRLTPPHPRAKERAFVPPLVAVRRQCRPRGRRSRLRPVSSRPTAKASSTPSTTGSKTPPPCPTPTGFIAQRVEQASADMRELLENLTGEISHLADLGAPTGELSDGSRKPGRRGHCHPRAPEQLLRSLPAPSLARFRRGEFALPTPGRQLCRQLCGWRACGLAALWPRSVPPRPKTALKPRAC